MLRERLWHFQHRYAPYLFVSPFVILFLVFMVYPLTRSIVLSLYQIAGEHHQKFVGLGNYQFLLHDKYFWLAVINTTILAAVFICVQIPASLGLALVLNAKGVKAKNFFRFAFFSTYLVGSVFVSVLFSQMLNQRQGLLNRILGLFLGKNPEIPWLTDQYLARISILMAWLWISVGWGMIYFLAALQAVDRDLYEAASVDGAGSWRKFWNVTLPGIRPVLVYMILIGTIGGFQLFEIPYVLFPSGSGPNWAGLTIVAYLFTTGFQTGDLGLASAIGWMLVLIILAVSIAQYRLGFSMEKTRR
jgi:ABC-type sugar transport system permease subunit